MQEWLKLLCGLIILGLILGWANTLVMLNAQIKGVLNLIFAILVVILAFKGLAILLGGTGRLSF